MRTLLPFTLLLLFLLSASNSHAQQTGAFTDSIMFNGANRGVSYYVPANYDSTKEYKLLVGLHGCFNNGAGYRNTLQNLSDSLDGIVMCPDGPYDGTGWMLGTEADVIRNSIDSTRAVYSINDSCVYLTGFSCNGAVTYKEGLAPVYPFAGIIPFNAGNLANLKPFNYSSGITTCICSGTLDNNYSSNQNEHTALQNAGVTSYFNSIPNVGHTTAFPTFDAEMMECLHWIDSVKTDTSFGTSFKDDLASISFGVFPNPIAREAWILPNGISPEGLTLYLYDATGKFLRDIDHVLIGKALRIVIDEPAGFYMIRMESGERQGTQKILVR